MPPGLSAPGGKDVRGAGAARGPRLQAKVLSPFLTSHSPETLLMAGGGTKNRAWRVGPWTPPPRRGAGAMSGNPQPARPPQSSAPRAGARRQLEVAVVLHEAHEPGFRPAAALEAGEGFVLKRLGDLNHAVRPEVDQHHRVVVLRPAKRPPRLSRGFARFRAAAAGRQSSRARRRASMVPIALPSAPTTQKEGRYCGGGEKNPGSTRAQAAPPQPHAALRGAPVPGRWA